MGPTTTRIVALSVAAVLVAVGVGIIVVSPSGHDQRGPENATQIASDPSTRTAASLNANGAVVGATIAMNVLNVGVASTVPTGVSPATSPNTNHAGQNTPSPLRPSNVNTRVPSTTNTGAPLANTNHSPTTNTAVVPSNTNAPVASPALHAAFTTTGTRSTGVLTYTVSVFQGDTVSFDASSSTGAIATYTWDFGDGSSGSGQLASHRYNADPSLFTYFNVRLTVHAADGTSDATGGYYIWYIGTPRYLVRVDTVPASDNNQFACGQTIHAVATAYSPWGDVVSYQWQAPASSESASNESPSLTLPCGASGSTWKFTFILNDFRDSTGKGWSYGPNSGMDLSGALGSLTIVSYTP
jgi:PKD domain